MLPEYLKSECYIMGNNKNIIISGKVRFTVITSRLIRIEEENFHDEASQTVLNRNFEDISFKSFEQDGFLYIETEHLILKYVIGKALCEDSLQITLLTKPYTRWNYGDIAVHNLGGTVSTLDRVSGSCKLNDGVCSIEGYSVIDDSETALFNEDGWFKNRKCNGADLYFFGYGHDYINCVRDYCRLTGEVKMLPAYALGNWWSRYHKYSQDEYISLMDKFKEKDLPLSVAVLDMDWHISQNIQDEYWDSIDEKDRLSLGYGIGWTGYTWNQSLFPDYRKFLKCLHDRGLKVSLNLHPSGGIRFWEEKYPEMAEFMGISPESRRAVPFDCLNPEFLKGYFNIIHFPLEEEGVDFWWMDWQQGCDYNWIHQYGNSTDELEIISPLWMLNHVHYLASMRNNKRGLIFSRFSGYGSQRFPIGFSGDTYTSWESLEFQPYFTATASNIGYGWWSHDIGGHAGGDRDDELNTRWVQFGVFSPIFRFHSSSDKFLGREPWNYNSLCESVISDFMRLRHKLFPYLYTMNYRNFKEQTPLMLPMYYTNPEEKEAYSVKNQYWFGSELIVSPITKKADNESCLGYSDVWLPEGLWIDWFDGYVYSGGKSFECYRSIEKMPLFCKAGGIIPMQSHVSGTNKLGRSSELEIIIAAGSSGDFTMFEDDGESQKYESGDGVFTNFSLLWDKKVAKFVINSAYGNLSLIPEKRNYILIFKGFRSDCRFFVNGEEQKSQYYEETNSYKITLEKLSVKDTTEIIVECENGLLHNNSDFLDKCYKMLMHSQTTKVIRNHLYSVAEKMDKSMPRRMPEIIGENRCLKAFYELAIQLDPMVKD